MGSNLLEKFKTSAEASKIVSVPRPDGSFLDVKLVLLNEDATLMATLGADNTFKGHPIEGQNYSSYDVEVEIQQLFRAVKDPETGEGITKSITEFRKIITKEIRDLLAEELELLHEEYAPNVNKLNDTEFDKLLEDLKKKPKEILGTVSSLAIAKRLLHTLVSQPAV